MQVGSVADQRLPVTSPATGLHSADQMLEVQCWLSDQRPALSLTERLRPFLSLSDRIEALETFAVPMKLTQQTDAAHGTQALA